MLHTQLHGTHWQIGFQLGAGLARDGHFILDAVPFPITPARLEFARTCLPLCRRWFPAALEELRGLAQGQGRAPDELAGVLFSMYAMPPWPLLLLLCPAQGERGPVRPEQRLSHGAGRAQRQLPIPFFRRRLFFCGQHHLLPPDGGRRQSVRTGGGTHLGAPQPTPPRAECWSDPAAPAGILPGCSPGPGAAPAAPRLLLPHAGAGRPGWAYRPGGVCPEAHPDPLSRETDAFVCSVNSFHLSAMAPFRRQTDDDWRAEERYPTLTRSLAAWGPELDLQAGQDLLSGRMGFLCQYDRREGRDTVWSVLYDTASGTLLRAEGNPGRLPFQPDSRLSFRS